MKKYLLLLLLLPSFLYALDCGPMTIDYMEYSSDANAQTAYVTNAPGIDSFTKFLCHFDGTNGDTADQTAATGQTVILSGSQCQLNTGTKKFGSASVYMGGVAQFDYCLVDDSADWFFDDGDFTLDAWVFFHTLVAVNQWMGIFSQKVDTSNYWIFGIYESSGKYYLSLFESGGINISGAISISVDTPYHFAAVRSGTTTTIYMSGVTVASGTSANFGNYSSSLYLGFGTVDSGNYYFNGRIDEMRVDKGIARWTSDFSASLPAVAYPYPGPGGQMLQSLSESTIKTQGDYALKAQAGGTAGAEKSISRTLAGSIDLTGIDTLYYDIRSTLAGSNISLALHDSGGNSITHTANISSADAYETQTWDISGVSTAVKDFIDQITLTVITTNASNTFYVDNFYYIANAGCSSTATQTNTRTATGTPTATATQTNTATATGTRTSTGTATAIDTATETTTETATFSPTGTYTETATASPTQTFTPTQTATVTGSETNTQTNTQTATSTQTMTQTATATFTETPTKTATATNTATSMITNMQTATATVTLNPSIYQINRRLDKIPFFK